MRKFRFTFLLLFLLPFVNYAQYAGGVGRGDGSSALSNKYLSNWFIIAGNWNTDGNWSNQLKPTASEDANIMASAVVNNAYSHPNLTISSAGSVTISPGYSLTITGTIINDAGTAGLIIQSDATGSGTLVFASGTPNATVQRWVDKNAWHQVAPMTNASTANDFYIDGTNDSWLTYHTESTNGWTYITDLGTVLNRNQGYMYWIDNASSANTVEFTGTLTAADQSPSLTKDGSGWNLMGNPFSSAIDWDEGTWGTNDAGSVYVWDATLGRGDYKVWNGTAGALTGGIIPMGQGFFVQAVSAGSFTIPAAARVISSQAFYKSTDNDPTQYVRLQLDGNGYGNTVYVGFPENGTEEFDYRGDATKLYSSIETPQMFAIENYIELCINANAPLAEKVKTVPIYLVQVVDGDYTLTISDLDQLLNTTINLEDLKTGTIQNLRQTPVYSFSALNVDNPARFLLHFKSSTYGVEEPGVSTEHNMNIYAWENTIYIQSKGKAVNQEGMLNLYELSGQLLSEQHIGKGELVKVPVAFSDTYLIARVIKESDVQTEKVYIK